MESRILEELFFIDKTYFGSKGNNDFKYLKEFLEIESAQSNEIVLDLFMHAKKKFLNKKNNLRSFNILLEILEKNFIVLQIGFNKLSFVKNEKELSLLFLCFFILKFFTNHDPLKIRSDREKSFEEDIYSLLKNDSDSLINHLIFFLDKISIWIKINFGIGYSFYKIKIRVSLMWFLTELATLGSCLEFSRTLFPEKGILFQIKKPYEFQFNIEISHSAYKIYHDDRENIFLYSYHYTTLNTVFKPNPRSGISITKSESVLIALNNVLNNYIIISDSRLEKIIFELCEEYLIDQKTIYKSYRNLIDNYITYLKQKDKFLIQEISIEISQHLRIINLMNLKRVNKEDQRIYLSPMICFRGRMYFLSSASITFQKELRYCSHWGKYENLDLAYIHPLLKDIEIEIEKRHQFLNRLKLFDFTKEIAPIKNAVIWILVTIAETNKSKQPIWTLDDFLNEGIYLVNNWSLIRSKKNVEDRIKIDYHLNILDEMSKKIFIKWLISKDATASVFQHSAKVVGVRENETLKWCNFNSRDTWYDTYSFIINNWKETRKTNAEDEFVIKNYFTRSTLKNTIMTHNYGAKINSSFKRFFKIVKDKSKKEKLIVPEENKTEQIFNNFFDYLENKSSILLYSSKTMKKELKNLTENRVIFWDETTISLGYNNTKTIQIEEQINNKRITKQQIVILNSLDKRKIDSSIRANYVQGLDASLVRWFYATNNKGITVHDCFMVDYMSISFLIAIINQGMRIRFHSLKEEINFDENNIFSIFILL